MLSHAQQLQPWHTLSVVILDFETTGVDPATCMPVEVAAVLFEDGEPVSRANELINPGIPIPAEATAIHGITDEMVADAYPAPAAIDRVLKAASRLDAVPAAYNAPFDCTILRRILGTRTGCCELALLEGWPWLDPLVAVRFVDRYVRGSGRHRLANACERRGIKVDGAHRALADAELAGRLLFCDDIRAALGDMTISEVLRRQVKRAAEQQADFEAWRARQPPQETTP